MRISTCCLIAGVYLHVNLRVDNLNMEISTIKTKKLWSFAVKQQHEAKVRRKYYIRISYLLTPWSRVLLEKLTSKLCS